MTKLTKLSSIIINVNKMCCKIGLKKEEPQRLERNKKESFRQFHQQQDRKLYLNVLIINDMRFVKEMEGFVRISSGVSSGIGVK